MVRHQVVEVEIGNPLPQEGKKEVILSEVVAADVGLHDRVVAGLDALSRGLQDGADGVCDGVVGVFGGQGLNFRFL